MSKKSMEEIDSDDDDLLVKNEQLQHTENPPPAKKLIHGDHDSILDSDDDIDLLGENKQLQHTENLPTKKLIHDYGDDDSILDININEPGPSTSTQNQLQLAEENTELPVFRQTQRAYTSHYESLDYEVCENELWHTDQSKLSARFSSYKDIARWIIFLQIGIMTALVACGINIVIEELSSLKYQYLKDSVEYNVLEGNLCIPYLFWLLLSIVPVFLGASLVTYVEPIAAGSGIPQVKCYLNGVKVPRIVRIKTLAVKAIGVITSVVGGLAGGKEGPMIHCGAVIAAGISQGKSTTFVKDFKVFKYFRDDHEKRDFVLGGAAAGVAAAFGAPIGGVLFSLEEAASFWNQYLIWRTLVAAVFSSFTLNIVLSSYHGLSAFTFPGLFNLGKFDNLPYEYLELPIFIVMGVFGGLLGAIWNASNTKFNIFRGRFIKHKWAKVCEAVIICGVGVTIACIMMYTINDCRPLGNDPTNYPVQLFCDDNEYNAVAALWFQTPEASVKSLFHDPPGSHNILTLAIFLCVYYFLSCVTFGLNVSLGIFIPTVLVGASWGRLTASLLNLAFPTAEFLIPGKYALLGAAAQLGGVLRMTISLSVILIETTGIDTSFAFPLIITLISAKLVGDCFNEGIYDTQTRLSEVPMLHWQPPQSYQKFKAHQIMSSPVICFKLREKVTYIYNTLQSCKHNGFPVVDDVHGNDRSEGRVCGFILRSQLILIIKHSLYEEKKSFWEKIITLEVFRNEYPRYPSIMDVQLNVSKHDYTVDSTMFMNPSPIRVGEMDSVPKIFQIFRALGLRHMVVINKENRVSGIITRKNFISH